MNWKQLLSDKRSGFTRAKSSRDLRTEFQRDYHRIIGSASFRRLQDKTQVFPLDKSDFVRTRLTHSLEVASFAKSLGQAAFTYITENNLDAQVDDTVRESICSILECAGLLHDIGNPPFGHFGEDSIRDWFRRNLCQITLNGQTADELLSEQMKNDLYFFEGNAQALRLLTKLHYLVDENGMHLTYALLNTIVKYPVSSCGINKKSGNIKDKKMGYYFAEEDIFKKICEETGAINCRYPLTYLLEAADDIAYKTADIEDAVKKGFIDYSTLLAELKSEKRRARCSDEAETAEYDKAVAKLEQCFERAVSAGMSDFGMNAVQNWIIYAQGALIRCAVYGFTRNYRAIMDGTFDREILSVSNGNALADALGDIAFRYVFSSKPIYKREAAEGTIMEFLLTKFIDAAVVYDTPNAPNAVQKKLMGIVSKNYREIYKIYSKDKTDGEKLYLRLLLITDYICGMTDSYAKRLYQELNGII